VPIICPTVTAEDLQTYNLQIKKVTPFVHRIQIDLMDGKFTPNKSVSPAEAWWPVGMKADVHLMFSDPMQAVQEVIKHSPNLIIIHAESDGDFDKVRDFCRNNNVNLGVALLPKTKPQLILKKLDQIDHVLIFSGNLGYQGGSHADLGLLEKVTYLKERKPNLEIGWDGGVSDRNVSELVFGGVDVLNVGGFIQKSDNPEKAYNTLFRIADETGTT
jgi:ribulose-phosphate 3-epimerase